jgi:hypothetical protein
VVVRRSRPSREILSGESADVYFARADRILQREGLDPVVTMEVFARRDAMLCGIDEVKNLLAHVLGASDPGEVTVEALSDGDSIAPKEVVLRISARYRAFGLYETAILGMLAQSTGWATAAREVVEAAAPATIAAASAADALAPGMSPCSKACRAAWYGTCGVDPIRPIVETMSGCASTLARASPMVVSADSSSLARVDAASMPLSAPSYAALSAPSGCSPSAAAAESTWARRSRTAVASAMRVSAP